MILLRPDPSKLVKHNMVTEKYLIYYK